MWISGRAPKKISDMPRPSDFFIFTDTICYDESGSTYRNGIKYGQFYVALDRDRAESGGFKPNGIHVRHSGKASAIFADGHVEFQSYKYFCDIQDKDNWQAPYSAPGAGTSKPGYKVYDNQSEWVWISPGVYERIPPPPR